MTGIDPRPMRVYEHATWLPAEAHRHSVTWAVDRYRRDQHARIGIATAHFLGWTEAELINRR